VKNENLCRTPRSIRGLRVSNLIIAGAMVFLAAAQSQLYAQSTAVQFVPFANFMEGTQSASFSEYAGLPGIQVTDAGAFEEMRQHILTMYQGVNVQHSFVQGQQHFDCVPMGQQPSVRLLGLSSVAAPPPVSAIAHNAPAAGAINVTSQTAAQAVDQFGNAMGCAEGSIPMRRITLTEMTRFPTLQRFFSKSPDGSVDGVPAGAANPSSTAHKYSYTYQYVTNLGGNSSLNLWKPNVNTGLGEVFSLSQQWYVGGSGSSTQTAEVGWQNYPSKYGSENSALFIYWTRDDYNKTGCYNLDCAGFVQTNSSWHFGGGFSNYSTFGGSQYEFAAQYYLSGGNWWLALGGAWVGYYPGSIYSGGQMAHSAQLIEYGTESVGSTWYPPEGSGDWSSLGWEYAAYQRNLFYINTSSGSVWDTLTPAQPSPACYSITGPYYSSSSGWGIYFYEGGPGGTGC